MAKYCSKCGRALPDGVEICPDCHASGAEKDDAALFTRMTAETEVWKDTSVPEKRERRRKKIYSMRERLMLYLAAVLLVIFTAFIIYYTLPATRVVRAIEGESFDKAMSIYSEKLAEKGEEKNSRITSALEKKAKEICARYEAGELEKKDAEALFAGLYAFGIGSDGIDAQYAVFDSLKDMRSVMDKADALRDNGSYLEACGVYLTIGEDEPDYPAAQESAAACLELYGQAQADRAQELMTAQDYPAAVGVLVDGNAQLDEYGTFSAAIDEKLAECCREYEAFALSEAESLAKLDKYTEAAAVLRECMDSPVGETEELLDTYENYILLSENKTSDDAIKRADGFYTSGDYANAFTELETAAGLVEDPSLLEAAIRAMERRYASDMNAKADALVVGDRDKLADAIALLTEAQQVRSLDAISTHIAELESYLPLDIVTAPFSDREGEVFRSTGSFYAIGGTIYTDGWLWGANEASISYKLDGKYDLLECDFAVRRDDGKKVSGYFEVWCDGKLKYTADTIDHSVEPQKLSIDISGCTEMKLVFFCDYSTVTGEGGYCYHGICSPVAVKRLPAELSAAETAAETTVGTTETAEQAAG